MFSAALAVRVHMTRNSYVQVRQAISVICQHVEPLALRMVSWIHTSLGTLVASYTAVSLAFAIYYRNFSFYHMILKKLLRLKAAEGVCLSDNAQKISTIITESNW